MADALTYVKGLRPQNKIGAAVGSFGWSGECVNILNEWLEKMSCDIIEPQIKAKTALTTTLSKSASSSALQLQQQLKKRLLNSIHISGRGQLRPDFVFIN